MRFDFAMSEQELMRELGGDYWPLTIDELEVNRPYPLVPQLTPGCTVYVREWASARVY